MKLQRVLVRKNKEGKPFHKWQVTLPPDVVEALDWKPGDDLTVTVEDGRLVITRD